MSRKPGREFRRILTEALALAVAGLGAGLVANWISPRGLSLTRDYFPRAAVAVSSSSNSPIANATPAPRKTSDETNPPQASVGSRLREKGLTPVDRAEVERLFRDPRSEQELIVFIDARDDRHFQEGHIPGAYQFDRYYPERHLPTVLPACLGAMNVVVYCAGGQCEDSEFAALALKEAGVPPDRLAVFTGGIAEWTKAGLPVELEGRRSGRLKEAKP